MWLMSPLTLLESEYKIANRAASSSFYFKCCKSVLRRSRGSPIERMRRSMSWFTTRSQQSARAARNAPATGPTASPFRSSSERTLVRSAINLVCLQVVLLTMRLVSKSDLMHSAVHGSTAAGLNRTPITVSMHRILRPRPQAARKMELRNWLILATEGNDQIEPYKSVGITLPATPRIRRAALVAA